MGRRHAAGRRLCNSVTADVSAHPRPAPPVERGAPNPDGDGTLPAGAGRAVAQPPTRAAVAADAPTGDVAPGRRPRHERAGTRGGARSAGRAVSLCVPPQESLTPFVLAGMVATIDRLHPVAVVETGDLIDNANELDTAAAILRGGRVNPDSGASGYGSCARNPTPADLTGRRWTLRRRGSWPGPSGRSPRLAPRVVPDRREPRPPGAGEPGGDAPPSAGRSSRWTPRAPRRGA